MIVHSHRDGSTVTHVHVPGYRGTFQAWIDRSGRCFAAEYLSRSGRGRDIEPSSDLGERLLQSVAASAPWLFPSR